jgi:MYXO-CTERM domain-containing protein
VHVGSVIVGDANGRFFEPGAPRNTLLALVGLTALAAWRPRRLQAGGPGAWGAELPPGQRAGQRQHLAGCVAR